MTDRYDLREGREQRSCELMSFARRSREGGRVAHRGEDERVLSRLREEDGNGGVDENFGFGLRTRRKNEVSFEENKERRGGEESESRGQDKGAAP